MRLVVGGALLCLSSATLAATTVVVKPLSDLLVETVLSAPAQVVNDNHATISSRLSANVEKVLVSVGDQVEAGQALVKLECRDYLLAKQQSQSAIKSLQAQTRLARQQLSRAEKLLKQRNASLELRDQRRAELSSLIAQEEGAKVGLSSAELAVERCTLKAPFSGAVTARIASEGDLVAPGSPLLKVLGDEYLEVSANLTEPQIVNVGDLEKIYFQASNDRYPLALRAVIPFVDKRARTQEVRFTFAKQAALTGSSGRVVWQEPYGRLPIQYVVSRKGQLGLMQLENGKARFVVLPNAVEGQAPQVELPLDQLIIVEGQHGIEAGQDVIVAE